MRKIVLILTALVLGAISFAATSQVNNVYSFGGILAGFAGGLTPVATNPSVVPINAANVKTLFGLCSTNGFATPREIGATAGYQAPANGFLILEWKYANTTTGTMAVSTGYGDTDVGLNSASAPTNPQLFSYVQVLASSQTYDNVKALIPSGKYLYQSCNTSPGYHMIVGIEL